MRRYEETLFVAQFDYFGTLRGIKDFRFRSIGAKPAIGRSSSRTRSSAEVPAQARAFWGSERRVHRQLVVHCSWLPAQSLAIRQGCHRPAASRRSDSLRTCPAL